MQETQETQALSLDQKDPLEKEMETHSSILAWKIPRAEEPGGLTVHGAAELDMTEQVSTHVRKLASPLLQREIPYKCSKVVATPTSLQSQPGRKDSLDHPPVHLTGEGVVSTPGYKDGETHDTWHWKDGT